MGEGGVGRARDGVHPYNCSLPQQRSTEEQALVARCPRQNDQKGEGLASKGRRWAVREMLISRFLPGSRRESGSAAPPAPMARHEGGRMKVGMQGGERTEGGGTGRRGLEKKEPPRDSGERELPTTEWVSEEMASSATQRSAVCRRDCPAFTVILRLTEEHDAS